MTIIMLSWEYPPHLVGGLARHVHGLATALAAKGRTVHVLTRSAPGMPLVESLEEGVHVHRVAPYFQEPHDFRLWVTHLNFALMEAGVRLLQATEGPVLLHAHDWLVAYAAKGLKHLFRHPLVATIHATEHGRQKGIHNVGQQYINDVEWWLTYEAWQVVVCSEAMRTEVRNLFGLNDDKVIVIPNGIEPATVPGEAPPRTVYATPQERLLFHIGRLVPEKGADVLIEALPLLLRYHAVRLVIGGKGPYESELRRRAREVGVDAHVHFAGFVDDATAQALFRYADVAVVPSTYEPFGIVALEAMAAGVPLVVTDVGGLTEIVRHGENGLKAEPGDPVSLAVQIDRLLSDGAFARRLARTALADVQSRYTWSSVAHQTAAVYDAVLSASAQASWSPELPPPASGDLPGRYTM